MFLGIHILHATGLKDKDWGSGKKSDPYFICRIGSIGSSWEEKALESNGLQFRSQTFENELNPVFDAKFTLDLSEDWVNVASMTNDQMIEGLELTLKIWDKDEFSRDDALGNITIGIPRNPQEAEVYPVLEKEKSFESITIAFYMAGM